jgi:hypothetical protein
MTPLYPILEALTNLCNQAGFWLVVWIVLLVGGSVYIFRLASAPEAADTPEMAQPLVVRKGECPFCGSALFGTTHAYERLELLDTVSPQDQYLCIDCDQEKVSELLSLLEDGR